MLEADAQRCFLQGDNGAVCFWAFPSSASSVAAGVFSPRPMKNVTSRTKRIMLVLTTTTVTMFQSTYVSVSHTDDIVPNANLLTLK